MVPDDLRKEVECYRIVIRSPLFHHAASRCHATTVVLAVPASICMSASLTRIPCQRSPNLKSMFFNVGDVVGRKEGRCSLFIDHRGTFRVSIYPFFGCSPFPIVSRRGFHQSFAACAISSVIPRFPERFFFRGWGMDG